MLLQKKLYEYMLAKKAILAANFYNFETLSGILQAAKNTNALIILQLSESSINYLGLKIAANIAKTALAEYNVEGWLHLDHGSTLEIVAKCLDAGFDSVMIDASEKSFEENIRLTKEVVKLAQQYNANVEAELGYVAKLGQQFDKAGFTKPDDAFKFVMETNVPTLAIAIGSAHGFYKQLPKLDIDLLSQIHNRVNIPLVLHGSSGIPQDILQNAVRHGISKVNLATETKSAFMSELKRVLENTDEIDLRKVFPKAIQSVINLIQDKIEIINSF